jgi:putative membrane protein
MLVAAAVSPVAVAAESSESFIQMAIQGDIAEIKAGQLAEKDGASAGVKKFGATLAKDHAKAKSEAVAVAKELKVVPPTEPTAEAQAEYKKLAAMSGKSFDHAFVQAMVEDHQKTIAAFKEEAAAKDGKASTMAKAQLPVLEKHLKIAESLQKEEKSASAQ